MKCKSCKNYRECLNEANKRGEIFDPEYDGEHGCGANSFEKISNGDRIRSMTDEELVKLLNQFCVCDKRTHEECTILYRGVCNQCALDWLQQEADEINI